MFNTIRNCGIALIPCEMESVIEEARDFPVRLGITSDEAERVQAINDEKRLGHVVAVKFARNAVYASTSILVIAVLCLLKTAAKSTVNYVCKGLIVVSAASDLYSLFRLFQAVKKCEVD